MRLVAEILGMDYLISKDVGLIPSHYLSWVYTWLYTWLKWFTKYTYGYLM